MSPNATTSSTTNTSSRLPVRRRTAESLSARGLGRLGGRAGLGGRRGAGVRAAPRGPADRAGGRGDRARNAVEPVPARRPGARGGGRGAAPRLVRVGAGGRDP